MNRYSCNKTGQDNFKDTNRGALLGLLIIPIFFTPNTLITLMWPISKTTLVFNAFILIWALVGTFSLLRGLIKMRVSVVRGIIVTDQGLELETNRLLLNKPMRHKIDLNKFESGIEDYVMSEANVGEVIYIKSGKRTYYVVPRFFDNFEEVRKVLLPSEGK